jgi:hypothetical protein
MSGLNANSIKELDDRIARGDWSREKAAWKLHLGYRAWRYLRDSVYYAKISPEDAENKARNLRLEPLATEPSQEQFKPLEEKFWSLGMAMAWIIWRKPTAVRRAWQTFLDHSRYWSPNPFGGYDLIRLRPTLSDICSVGYLPNQSFDLVVGPAEAWDQLKHALEAEKILAHGVRVSTGAGEQIPGSAWAVLQIERDRSYLFGGLTQDPQFTNIKISSEAIFQEWPRNTISGQAEVVVGPRTRGPKPEKKEKVVTRMKRDLDHGEITKAELRDMSDKALTTRYGIPNGAERTTVREALNSVLSEANSDN